jgi:two-component system NtrC family sensor kinase
MHITATRPTTPAAKRRVRGASAPFGRPTHAAAPFQALLEAAPDAVVIVDATGRIVIVNSQLERLFGYARAELLGQPMELLLPDALRLVHQRHRDAYAAAPCSRLMGSGLDLSARRKDGSTFSVEVSLSAIQSDVGILITSIIRDVTERKDAADALERQVQRRTAHLDTLLQCSQELLGARGLDSVLHRAISHAIACIPDAQGGAIYLYDADCQRLVLRAAAGCGDVPKIDVPIELGILGQVFTTRLAAVASDATQLAMLICDSSADDRQHTAGLPKQAEVPSAAVALPLVTHDQAIGVLLLTGAGAGITEELPTLSGLANLTAAAILAEQNARAAAQLSDQVLRLEQQQGALAARLTTAEAAMLQAARLAAVGQLAAAVAHEINNPLYAVRNCLYLHEQDLPPELRDSEFMTLARDELTRIAGIIVRMRDFYRPDRGELTPCDLNQVLEETLTLAHVNMRHTGIELIFSPAADLLPVIGNSDQLRQVFLNLILNAIDAMPQAGTLTVRTVGSSTVALVEVQDSGVGIPAEIRARLFEPFFTSKPAGTGLGLAISAHIVTQHGGQIEVESVAGQGSTFRVVLPMQPRT